MTLFNSWYAFLQTRLQREEGQTMAEYGVVLALITITVVGAFLLLGENIEAVIRDVAGRL